MLMHPTNSRTEMPHRPSAPSAPEPRWPAIVAGLAMAGMYAVLHQSLLVGPRWLLPALVLLLVIPARSPATAPCTASTSGSGTASRRA